MDSLTNGDEAEFPKDLVNTEIMATSKEVKEQAGKVFESIESVAEQDKTELVIEQVVNKVETTEDDQQVVGQPAVSSKKDTAVEPTEGDKQVVGQPTVSSKKDTVIEPTEGDRQVVGRPAVSSKKDTVSEKLIEFKEPIVDGTEDVIEEEIELIEEVEYVVECVRRLVKFCYSKITKRLLQFLETKEISGRSNMSPKICKGQACAPFGEWEFDRSYEKIEAKLQMDKLFDQAGTLLDVAEESDNFLSELQALQREKTSTQDNLKKVSKDITMANINSSYFVEQAEKVLESIKSAVEQNNKTELVIEQVVNKVETTEEDRQVVGQPAMFAKKDSVVEKMVEINEQIADGTDGIIEKAHFEEVDDVTKRVKRVLNFYYSERIKKISQLWEISGLSHKYEETYLAQDHDGLAEFLYYEENKATEQIIKLLEEAEKILKLAEESVVIFSKIKENLEALQRKEILTRQSRESVTGDGPGDGVIIASELE